ncbi:DUF192 domain-containing protein [Natronomonas sp. LN261]|uniref:DUF192 domain-containing protein n=1 Tax=Natronomonas sp. LN261 TaxID=2750669 RepID=UPI0015EED908|nr:DUF192 domain-containing protein [Natronomonas sp. LN261]
MDSRVIAYGLLVAAVVGIIVGAAFWTGLIAPLLGDGYDPEVVTDDYERTAVTVVDGETGAELGTVEAAVADTFIKRYVGLSGTDELPEDRGMLFVHESPGEYTYVMRDMSFGLDIVFVDHDGTITTIHEAPPPAPGEDGNAQEYRGRGQYVLEVPLGWTAERGIEAGDEVRFEL